jgi:hypothetical protein
MLAGDNHQAGFLLLKICYWHRYAKAKIPKIPGTWVANKREWWGREARLSLGQYDRAASRLVRLGLIEKRQFWFGQKNILYARPTSKVRNFLAAATTWEAAELVLAQSNSAAAEPFGDDDNFEEPGSSTLVNSNCVFDSDVLGSSDLALSNSIINPIDTSELKTEMSAQTPSALCAKKTVKKKKSGGKKNIKYDETKSVLSNKTSKVYKPPPGWSEKPSQTLQQVAMAWIEAMGERYPNNAAVPACIDDLSPELIGGLGKLLNGLFVYRNGISIDLRWAADRFIKYVISNLPEIEAGAFDLAPDMTSFRGRACSGYAPQWGVLQIPSV